MRLHPPPWPSWVNVENTLRCNLDCIWCAQALVGSTRSGVDMPLPLFHRIAAEVLPRVSRLSFSVAGEPTIAPHFLDFLDVVNELDLTTELVTNGTALHRPGLLERLLPRLALMIVSIDGARAGTVERIRVGARFERLLANLGDFDAARRAKPVTARPELALAVTLSTANVAELPEVVALAAKVGAARVLGSWLQVLDPSLLDLSLHHRPMDVARFTGEARAAARRLGVGLELPDGPPEAPPEAFARRALGLVGTRSRRRAALRGALQRARVRAWELRSGLEARCSYLWGRAYLHADGHVSPCCVQGRPYVGDLNDASFAEIWTGPAMTALRAGMFDGHPHEACTRCSVGQGPAAASAETWVSPRRNLRDAG